MRHHTFVVDGYRCDGDTTDLDGPGLFNIALDQRVFGRHRLLVATAKRSGKLLTLTHCQMAEPIVTAFGCCLDLLSSEDAAVVVAYSDEPVGKGPVSAALAQRFFEARAAASDRGLYLLDWLLCTPTDFRSLKLGLIDGGEWWDVPPLPGDDAHDPF